MMRNISVEFNFGGDEIPEFWPIISEEEIKRKEEKLKKKFDKR